MLFPAIIERSNVSQLKLIGFFINLYNKLLPEKINVWILKSILPANPHFAPIRLYFPNLATLKTLFTSK